MVSLEIRSSSSSHQDRLPFSESSSPAASAASIYNRSTARSMRTVRSNYYSPSQQHQRRESSEEEDDHHLRYSSARASENLSDSVVDFRLHELALATAPASASAACVGNYSSDVDFAAHLLDLDDDDDVFLRQEDGRRLSDSFASDISGELQRLASIRVIHPDQYQQKKNGGGSSNAEEESVVLLGPWVESIVSSSEILESASAESLEPAVRACMDVLESGSASTEAKRTAAGKLRLLAKHRSDFRAMIGACGALPALVGLLRSTDPGTQENAVTAVLNLSLEEGNRGRLRAAGAIKPLVYALRTGTAVAKQNAACGLLSLSMSDDESRATIGACGAIPPLVSLLVSGSTRGKKDALTALYKLCGSPRQNKERAVQAGAVGPLLDLIGSGSSGTADKATVVLSCLAGIRKGRDAIVEAGGIPALVEAIEDSSSSSRAKEFAVVTLLQLCADSPPNRALLIREGAIPPLVALSQSASSSARARHKAETLLGYLREQRQQESDCASTVQHRRIN